MIRTSEHVRWLARGMESLPASLDWLAPSEREWFDRFRFPKRRNEWRLARWTAKGAMARHLGRDPEEHGSIGRLAVRHAPSGAPMAYDGDTPAGLSLSLTDRADWAVCMVVDGDHRIGCDLELVEPRSDNFVADFLTPGERRQVDRARDPDHRALLANLVWSAKESALKVLQTGLRRDTRSVEVRLDAEESGWSPLEVRSVEGGVFPGWWRRYGSFVLTMAANAPCEAPVPFEEPPGLERAVPTHGWMNEHPSPVPRPR